MTRYNASLILNMPRAKKPDGWRNVPIETEFKTKGNSVLDVRFSVDKGRSRKIFWANKSIIAQRCPAFETMYFEKCTKKVTIEIPDDDREAFGMLLRFIYEEDLEFSSLSVACKTYSLGTKYRLPDLQRAVMTYVHAVAMNNKKLLNIVENDFFSHAAVEDRCIKYICENTEELVKSDSFLKMPEDIVNFILQVDDISVGEFTLLMAVTQWCYNRYAGEINFKEKLLKFLGQIRYSDVTTSEFDQFIKHFPDAMDLENSSAIVKYINKSTKHPPSWCTKKGHRRTF